MNTNEPHGVWCTEHRNATHWTIVNFYCIRVPLLTTNDRVFQRQSSFSRRILQSSHLFSSHATRFFSLFASLFVVWRCHNSWYQSDECTNISTITTATTANSNVEHDIYTMISLALSKFFYSFFVMFSFQIYSLLVPGHASFNARDK